MNACGNCSVCGGPMRNELFTSLCAPYCPRDCGVNSKPAVQGRQRWWLSGLVSPAHLNINGPLGFPGGWYATHPDQAPTKGTGVWAYASQPLVRSTLSDYWRPRPGTTWEPAPEPVVAEPSKAACTHGPWVMDNTSKWRCLGCGYISQSHTP